MEPISAAIVAAVAKLAEPGIRDAYNALKIVIKRKFGAKHEVVDAVEAVESHPDSAGRAATLNEEVVKAGGQTDAEVLAATQALMKVLEAQPGGTRIVQNVKGNHNVVAARDANVNFGPKN